MADRIRTDIDYHAAADLLTTALHLDGSPVAVRLARTKEDIPAGIPPLEETVRHCMMVGLARKEGKTFYATADKHQCAGGAWSLGLKPITETLKSGEFYFKLGKFESWAACKRTIENVPHLETSSTFATVYAPLATTPFDPDVVLVIAQPFAMLKLAQTHLFQLGGRINATFSGIQSVCSDTTAQTYLTGKPCFSLGCDGSRKYSGIGDGEMVLGIPAEALPAFLHALPVIMGAAGSAHK